MRSSTSPRAWRGDHFNRNWKSALNFGVSGLGGAVGRGTLMSGTGGGEDVVGEGEGMIVGVGECGVVTHMRVVEG